MAPNKSKNVQIIVTQYNPTQVNAFWSERIRYEAKHFKNTRGKQQPRSLWKMTDYKQKHETLKINVKQSNLI